MFFEKVMFSYKKKRTNNNKYICIYIERDIYMYIYIYIYIKNIYRYILIDYGLEATPSILELQIVFVAARRDEYDDCGARQEL